MNSESVRTRDTEPREDIHAAADKAGTMPSPAPLSKMTSGSETLRDHDFPAPDGVDQEQEQPAAIDTNQPPPEQVRSGGSHGTIKGDSGQQGEVPTIMDQDASTPDFKAEK